MKSGFFQKKKNEKKHQKRWFKKLPSMDNARYGCPICFFNIITAINHSLISLTYEVYLYVECVECVGREIACMRLHHDGEMFGYGERDQSYFVCYLAAQINAHTHNSTYSCIHTL